MAGITNYLDSLLFFFQNDFIREINPIRLLSIDKEQTKELMKQNKNKYQI